MDKIIINCTEGGARIKGTIQMPLCDYIKEYCQDPIDKSKLKPLLELADNGNELVEKVIPLLEDDIDNLDTIIKSSRIGLAASFGLRTLMPRNKYIKLMNKKAEKIFKVAEKEAVSEAPNDIMKINTLFYEKIHKRSKKPELKHMIKLSQINSEYSQQAHITSTKNPLVNVAIYGASRQIQGRELKAKGTVAEFLKDKKTAETRLARNKLILSTAKKASESLKKSYEETLELLKKYNETKDDNILRPIIKEKINLDDADSYFDVGNWAHPLLDANKIKWEDPKYQKAKEIHIKAMSMKDEAIKNAKQNEKENLDQERKLLKYNQLIEDAKEIGKIEKDYGKALELLKKATEVLPDEIEGRWGYATALHHSNKLDEAIIEYKKLTKDFPDNSGFLFEYGQVLIRNNQIQDGLKEISKAMEITDEYDSFLIRVGEIYEQSKMYDEAIIAYENYLTKFPHDFNAWMKKGNCFHKIGKTDEAKKAYKKAKQINPKALFFKTV